MTGKGEVMVPLLKRFEQTLDYVAERAADLVVLRATLVACDDVIVGMHASTEPSEEPYFCIHISDPYHESDEIWIRFTATRIVLIRMCSDCDDEGMSVCDKGEMTLTSVFDLLRQLPRSPGTYLAE